MIRDDSIYVSWQTRSGLKYVADAMGLEGRTDALAEQVLADWLKDKHPDVVEHMKVKSETDDAFKKALALKLKSTSTTPAPETNFDLH